jgi:eukaryotic-like serine/threonine-protein kinase
VDPNAAAPAAPGALAPGDLVADRYRLVELLGEGGMGAVFRAEHIHMRKAVALKVLLPELTTHPEAVARFAREAVAAGNIDHPNVAAATDFGQLPNGSFFLVLELIEGRSLREELASGRLEPARALRIVSGIVAGVEAAHAKGIVHRDLKPENVMLVERGGEDAVKVLDFGIARMDPAASEAESAEKPKLTQVGAIMGTPDYMAPEQALGQPVDARTDLYSLGVMLYELLAGHCPFQGGAVSVMREHVLSEAPPLPDEVVARVPAGIPDVIRRLLAKDPSERPATAAELRALLDAAVRAPSPLAGRAPSPSPSPPPSSAAPSSSGPPSPPGTATTRYDEATPSRRGLQALVAAGLFVSLGALIVALAMRSAPVPAAGGVAAPEGSSLPGSGVAATPAEGLASETAEAVEAPPPAPKAAAAASEPASPSTSTKPGGTAEPPKSRARAPAKSKPAATRKTGPGGIYVPPPKDWFK